MRRALAHHWPEYLMEAALLGLFMISAGLFTTLIEYPGSPVRIAITSAPARRVLIGAAMGLTAIALIYSPWGRQSGAHFNPAVTITFLRLGKVKPWDAFFYIGFQFAGGLAGVMLVTAILRGTFSQPPVSYVATMPGPRGPWPAFLAETLISFVLMSGVLFAVNHQALTRFTGLLSGTLVALFITLEAPYSGMSMNPARTFSSAVPGRFWGHLWIYFVAPLMGMLFAVEIREMVLGLEHKACAKIHHDHRKRCIFCGHRIAVMLAVLLLAGTGLRAQAPNGRVESIALTVSNLDRSVRFYRQVLSFEEESETSAQLDSFVRVANLHLGAEKLQLIQYRGPAGRAYPADSRSNDRWFQHIAIVVRDMHEAYTRVRAARITSISTRPQTLPAWNKNAAGIEAFYFRDPDFHPLELIYFPPGKGDPKWQNAAGIFLGIDHTAIAVQNTGASVDFYRSKLGFHVAGESLNYGREQEQLNQVPGSRVRITSLRASAGPGIELLEYLAPLNGRAFPAEVRPNDLWNTYTMFAAGDLPPGLKTAPLAASGINGLLIRDPDGHELLVRTP